MANNVITSQELKKDLDDILRRVGSGESFEITVNDRPVAILTLAVSGARGLLDRLIASGLVTPPSRDLLDLGPPLELSSDISVSEALREQREERL